MLPGMRIRRGLRPIALIGVLAIVAGLVVPADRPADAAVHAAALPVGARRLALRPARDRVRRRTRRRRGPAGRRALRAPLPVPRRRREHRQRLGDLEHQRRLREVVRPGLGRQRHGRGVPVLPDAPELARDRRRRVREGPQQPQERHHDGRLLGRRPAVHAEGRGGRVRAPGGAARRARPVGLHRAGRRPATTRRTCPASVGLERRRRPRRPANTAAGFAKAFVKLRDLYAPNVLLAYHASVWGTMFDLHASQTSDAQTDQLAAKAAAFYGSLSADFDLVFTDLADRDAGVLPAPVRRRRRGRGGTPRTSRATAGSSAGCRRAPASASSCGRSRWATR